MTDEGHSCNTWHANVKCILRVSFVCYMVRDICHVKCILRVSFVCVKCILRVSFVCYMVRDMCHVKCILCVSFVCVKCILRVSFVCYVVRDICHFMSSVWYMTRQCQIHSTHVIRLSCVSKDVCNSVKIRVPDMTDDTLQHTATHCNTLQHTATHCNTLNTYTTYDRRRTYT